jgi:16S rRNA (guanine966-N2)-methyltransferase
VTRIVGGRARGRRLTVPPGSGTRPTTDRTREALFSTVEAMLGTLEGAVVVDAYAGSGALGLEAWSRGAAQVVLVERDARALAALRANVAALAAQEAVRAVPGSVAGVLDAGPGAAGLDRPADLVLLDPPYDLPEATTTAVLARLVVAQWLAEDALVVLERSSRGPAPAWPPGLEPLRDRRYGETTLWYGRAASRS